MPVVFPMVISSIAPLVQTVAPAEFLPQPLALLIATALGGVLTFSGQWLAQNLEHRRQERARLRAAFASLGEAGFAYLLRCEHSSLCLNVGREVTRRSGEADDATSAARLENMMQGLNERQNSLLQTMLEFEDGVRRAECELILLLGERQGKSIEIQDVCARLLAHPEGDVAESNGAKRKQLGDWLRSQSQWLRKA